MQANFIVPRRTKSNPKTDANSQAGLSARPQEQLVIDALDELAATTVLCNSAGRGQFAIEYARRYPETRIQCSFFDLYQKDRTIAWLGDEAPPNLTFLCESDLPSEKTDLAVVFCQKSGESEFSREILQQAHDRLEMGGRLIASIDYDDDQWLHGELKKMFPKVTRRSFKKQGAMYLATKTEPMKRPRDFHCEFAFRDEGRLIHMMSRPGVFSHRRLDLGARALLEWAKIEPEDHVLDLGCGTGAVGIAAALRGERVIVHAVDSNPRAIECTQWGAEKNGVADRVTSILNADGTTVARDWFDVVLANPPYFSNYRIAEHFLATAWKSLRRHGWVHVVTKAPVWFEEAMPEVFEEIEANEVRGYWIVSGRKPDFHQLWPRQEAIEDDEE